MAKEAADDVFREEVTAIDCDVSELSEVRELPPIVDYSVGLDAVIFQAVPAFLVAGACRLRRRA